MLQQVRHQRRHLLLRLHDLNLSQPHAYTLLDESSIATRRHREAPQYTSRQIHEAAKPESGHETSAYELVCTYIAIVINDDCASTSTKTLAALLHGMDLASLQRSS